MTRQSNFAIMSLSVKDDRSPRSVLPTAQPVIYGPPYDPGLELWKTCEVSPDVRTL